MTTAEDAHNIADMKYSMFPRSENRREIQGQTLQHSKLINLLEVEQICICVSSKSTTRSRTRWRGFHQREYPQPENLERIRPCQLKMVRIRRTRLLRTRTTESSSRNQSSRGVSILSCTRTRFTTTTTNTTVTIHQDSNQHDNGLALCHTVILDSLHPVGPGKTPTVHGARTREGRGWPDNKTRHETDAQQDAP